MGFWNPVKSSDDIQENIDKRFILMEAKESLEKDLSKLTNKIEKHTEKLRSMDVFSTSKSRRIKARITLDALCNERDTIQRRLDLIMRELNG